MKVTEAFSRIASVVEHLYAISTERQLTNPAIAAISRAAYDEVFS